MGKRRFIIGINILIGIAILVVLIKIVQAHINAPTHGIISTAPSTPTTSPGINLTPTSIKGKYASFNYPAGLKPVPSSEFSMPIVAVYNFSYRDVESWNLAIEIQSIPGGRLNDNSAYEYRKTTPSIYQETHLTINGLPVDVMTDKTVGGFSQVAFLVNSQYQATVSLNGDDASGLSSLQATFNMILDSWHW